MSGAEALAGAFARAAAEGRAALIPYLVAGDPDIATTDGVIDALSAAGCDAIELGVPYGDPLADGPAIAAAAHRALLGGVTLGAVFDVARRARDRGAPPIVLFTYANPVDHFGVERFADAAAAAGAAGTIVPDIPLEEVAQLRAALDARALVFPLLVAPTTPAQRAERIARASSGFVYVVSRLGVTGAKRQPDFGATAERVAELRPHARVPLCVGFGISTQHDVERVAAFADGAIVGSALVEAYATLRGAQAEKAVAAFVAPLRAATVRTAQHPA